MPRPLLAILLLLVPSLPLAAQQMPPIGMIDFYGLRTLPESTARSALGLREGDSVPDSVGPATRRLRALPNVADARLNLVCCSSDGKAILFVGVAELGAPVKAAYSAPTGSNRLPDDVVQLGRAFDDTLMAAVRQGQASEHDSAGHAFFDYPAANAIQHRYLAIAAAQLPMLRDVLHHSASAEHRALAAVLLGYAPNVADVVLDLENSIHDPDDAVRNNAMRALAVIARYAQQSPLLGIRVSATPFVDMLNSLVWTDRNKASFALFQLTTRRDPALLALLRAQALPALVDIARWRSAGHAYTGYMILGRVEGMPDDALEQAWKHGDRSAVLDSAARMFSPPPASAAKDQPTRPSSVTTPIDVPAMAAPRWTPFQRDSAIAVLSYHRARWSMSRPREYRYWETTTCFCFRFSINPRIVTVSDGRVTGATDTTGRRTDAAFVRAGSQRWAGIDALFDRLAAGIRDSAYAEVTVEYDTLRGYPTRAVFDRDVFTNDDELRIVIDHFEVLP